jgi:hypothetical protein
MKFHVPSFLLGSGFGALAVFAVLNGGACRPSPTPTDDDSKPVPVDAPKPAPDKPIAPVVKPLAVEPVAVDAVPAEAKPVPAQTEEKVSAPTP